MAAPRLIPGAPGSGYVSQFMEAGLPGAGARYSLVPTGQPAMDPALAAAYSKAYLDPANWRHTGGDAGLIGAGPGGGGFQPNIPAINRAATTMAKTPVNRFHGLAIGDSPGGAQTAALGVRSQFLQALQGDRNYEIANRQLRLSEEQRKIDNDLRRLALQETQTDRADLRADREERRELNRRQQALSELATFDELGGTEDAAAYKTAFDKIARDQGVVNRTLTSATSELFREAYALAEGTPGVTVAPGRDGMPVLNFDPKLAVNAKGQPINASEAVKSYNRAMSQLQTSPAMARVIEAQSNLDTLLTNQESLETGARLGVPLQPRQQKNWVYNPSTGRYQQASGSVPTVPRGTPVPLARTLPGGPPGVPYGDAPAIIARYRGTGAPVIPFSEPSLVPALQPDPTPAPAPAPALPRGQNYTDLLRYFISPPILR